MSRVRSWSAKRLVALALVAMIVVAAAAFGPMVRRSVRARAERLGVRVEVGWVLPTPSGIELRGVHLRQDDLPGVTAELERVTVSWGSPRTVLVEGGQVRIEGGVDELRDQLARARARLGSSAGEGGAGGATALEARHLSVSWSGDGASVEAREVGGARGPGPLRFQVGAATVQHPLGRATVAESGLELVRVDETLRVGLASTKALELELDLSSPPVGGASDAGPPPDPPGGRRRLAALRRALERFEAAGDGLLGPSGKVELAGVSAAIRHDGQQLGLGPATLRLRRDGPRLVAEYVAGNVEAAEGAGLAVDGLLVRSALPKAGEPLAVDVRGGPISLAALGVREGDFHLLDTASASVRAQAQLELDAGGEVLAFEGDVLARGLSLDVRALAKQPVRGLDASFRGKVRAALDGSKVSVTGGELEIGKVRINAAGEASVLPPSKADGPRRLKLEAKVEVPLVPCQAFLDAAPDGLLPTIAGTKLAGSFALKANARVDTANLERDYDVHWDASSTCRVAEVPRAIDVARFRAPFKRVVYSAHGDRNLELETGPGTASWTPYASIPRWMETAVVSFEDGRFHRHEGFDHEAIRNSIRENLRQRKFVRGASTITMQLAKNLYLPRDKTLSRKLEEALLTMYLEQALTKEQIIELYLNVVELAPAVYGIEAGAAHWFRTAPSRLAVSQAFYLGSILPNPRQDHFGPSGALSPGWLKHIRTVMKHAHKRLRLSDEELAAGLSEIPVRGSPATTKDPDAEPVPARDQAEEAEAAPALEE